MDCPICGANGKLSKSEDSGDIIWSCSHCGSKFAEDRAGEMYEKLQVSIKKNVGSAIEAAILREKTAIYYNLRSQLWEKIHANYIDSKAIVDICRKIKAIDPHDFLAEFFELANSGTEPEIAEYICEINVKENEDQ